MDGAEEGKDKRNNSTSYSNHIIKTEHIIGPPRIPNNTTQTYQPIHILTLYIHPTAARNVSVAKPPALEHKYSQYVPQHPHAPPHLHLQQTPSVPPYPPPPLPARCAPASPADPNHSVGVSIVAAVPLDANHVCWVQSRFLRLQGMAQWQWQWCHLLYSHYQHCLHCLHCR